MTGVQTGLRLTGGRGRWREGAVVQTMAEAQSPPRQPRVTCGMEHGAEVRGRCWPGLAWSQPGHKDAGS